MINKRVRKDGDDRDGMVSYDSEVLIITCRIIIRFKGASDYFYRDPNAPKKKRGAIEYDPEGDSCTRILNEWKRKKDAEKLRY